MDLKEQEITELKERLRKLEAERDAERHKSTVDTGGGAHVEGGVQSGRDFVGRDKHEHHYHGATGPVETEKAEALYRESIADRCGVVPLQSVDVSPSGGQAKPLSLAEIYISLDTSKHAPVERIEAALEKAARGEFDGLPELQAADREAERERETRPVSALEATVLNRCLVVIGEPGSGKSTFLDHLTWALALRRWDCLPGWPAREGNALPVPVTLRKFARWLAEQDKPPEACARLLWDYIEHEMVQRQLKPAVGVLESALEDGRAIVLLDGLDEVPADDEALLGVVKTTVQEFVERHKNNRHLITCRVLSYQEPHWHLAGTESVTFPDLELARFDEEKIDRFINAWYREVGGKWKLSPDEIEVLSG